MSLMCEYAVFTLIGKVDRIQVFKAVWVRTDYRTYRQEVTRNLIDQEVQWSRACIFIEQDTDVISHQFWCTVYV